MHHASRLFAGVCLLLPFSLFAAPVAPEAGQGIRALETVPLAPPPADSSISLPQAATSPVAPAENTGNAPRLTVTAFTVSGNEAISSEKLLAAVGDLTGRPLTLAELQGAAERITNIYRQEGWLLARAVIPAQSVAGGTVGIVVIEGRYGEVTVKNSSRVADAVLGHLTHPLRSGEGVRAVPLERSLMLLNDLPGVQVGSSLAAGKHVGSTDLLIDVQPGPTHEGGLSIDNHGNTYNGAWRLNGNVDINNPLGVGDRLSLRALLSDESQRYVRGQYERPVGPWATRAGAAYSWMAYELGKDFAVLESTGNASIATLYVTQPWWRQRQHGLSTQLSFDHKALKDETGFFGLDSEKSLNNVTLQFNGYWRDNLLLGAATSYSLGWTVGDLSLDSPDAVIQDVLLRSAGKFQKWNPALYRQQLLASNLTLLLQLRGQIASGNLDSAEKISLGGVHGVRAYPEGEASGDQGWIANAEFRYALDENWQAGLFVDAGGVTVNKNPVAADNHRQLSGIGLAAYWQPHKQWQATVQAAWPIGDEEPVSDTPRGAYVWGQLAWSF